MEIFLDIETIPEQPEDEAKARIAEGISAPATMSKPETIADWHAGAGKYAGAKDAAIEETYRKTAFDGTYGSVCSICAYVDDHWLITPDTNEHEIVGTFVEWVAARMKAKYHHTQSPYFIGHNITFDLKFLWQRCVILGIKPPFSLPFDGRHNKDFFCTMQGWAGFRGHIGQSRLAKALKLPPKPDDIDGSNVWDHYKAGNLQRIAEYNKHDVETNIQIFKRLKFR